jgi:alcohol dehydrogenase
MKFPGYYEFSCRARIDAGQGALERIPDHLAAMGGERPMLITDQGVVAAGLLDRFNAAVADRLTVASVVDDVPVDSSVTVVNRIADQYREKGCNALVALGGGSVLDTAKGVNIVVSESVDALMDLAGAGRIKRPLKPMVAVPTTAGTGSEVTLVAVIADTDKQVKLPFTSTYLVPDVAVLDARMTLTLPPAITAATAMDALTHAVEAYTCLQKNPLSDALAWQAIALIGANLMRVMARPDDADGRLALATAAALAGAAFSNAMVGVVHAIGHSVGALCHVPHGVCMAVLLPYGLEYNLHKNGRLTAELLLPMAGAEVVTATPVHRRADRMIAAVRDLNRGLKEATDGRHPCCLGEIRGPNGTELVPKEVLPEIAKTAMGDGALLYNPEELDYEDLLMVTQAAWAGEALDRSRIKRG